MIRVIIIDGIPYMIIPDGVIEFNPRSQVKVKSHIRKDFTDFLRQKEQKFLKSVLGELKKSFEDKKQ